LRVEGLGLRVSGEGGLGCTISFPERRKKKRTNGSADREWADAATHRGRSEPLTTGREREHGVPQPASSPLLPMKGTPNLSSASHAGRVPDTPRGVSVFERSHTRASRMFWDKWAPPRCTNIAATAPDAGSTGAERIGRGGGEGRGAQCPVSHSTGDGRLFSSFLLFFWGGVKQK